MKQHQVVYLPASRAVPLSIFTFVPNLSETSVKFNCAATHAELFQTCFDIQDLYRGIDLTEAYKLTYSYHSQQTS